MNLPKTQVELEEKVLEDSIDSVVLSVVDAEQDGRAHSALYASSVFRKYVQEVHDRINSAATARGRACLPIITYLGAGVCAYLAVRTALDTIMVGEDDASLRTTVGALGKAVACEWEFRKLLEESPDLYRKLRAKYERQASQDAAHLLSSARGHMKVAGVTVESLTDDDVAKCSMFLADHLIGSGLVRLLPMQQVGKKRTTPIELSEEAMEIRERLIATVPLFSAGSGPCIEEPRPWSTWTDGGFHTPRLRARSPLLRVKRNVPDWQLAPVPRSAINYLQRTAWRVNLGILTTAAALATVRNNPLGLMVRLPEDKPEWVDIEDPEELKAHKQNLAQYYFRRKKLRSKTAATASALREAKMFSNYPKLWFVWHFDSRGRMYPRASGISPQGHSLQRGLLELAEGRDLYSESEVQWFLSIGASRWGEDKCNIPDRAQWVRDNSKWILAVAGSPVESCEVWAKADDPWGFLAWAMEYAAWVENPCYEVRSMVAMDGTCNGLQHLSAMGRDESGASAVNLTPGPRRDLYMQVAQKTQASLAAEQGQSPTFAPLLAFGIKRDAVKRVTMTIPYGLQMQSARAYICDYLEGGLDDPPPIPEYAERADRDAVVPTLTDHTMRAIDATVQSAKVVMGWVEDSAMQVVKRDRLPTLAWTSPSGFIATQTYEQHSLVRYRVASLGNISVYLPRADSKPDLIRHRNGAPPNVIHSFDAAHMHRVVDFFGTYHSLDMAMIHDSFGCHPCDADALFRITRDRFAGIYSDPKLLRKTADSMGATIPAPDLGSWDPESVTQSEFAFL